MTSNYWNSRAKARARVPGGIQTTYVVPAIQLDPITDIKRMIRDRLRVPPLQTGATWTLSPVIAPVIEIPIGEI